MNEFQSFIADAITDAGWTPDVPVLETRESWPVFIYGARRGKSSSYFLHDSSEAEFVSIAWTKSDVYSILNIETPKRIYQLSTVQGNDRILGEVWDVPTEQLYDLDSDERNLLITKRILIPVVISGAKTISAWHYIAHPKYLLNGNCKISKYTGCTYYGSQKFLEIH